MDEKITDIVENLAEVLKDRHGINTFTLAITATEKFYRVSVQWERLTGAGHVRESLDKFVDRRMGQQTVLDPVAAKCSTLCEELENVR